MNAIRVRVTRIIDFGAIVSVVGIDLASNQPVMVHVDHRPFQMIWNTWKAANFPEPLQFDAERLTLNVEMDTDESGEDEASPAPAA